VRERVERRLEEVEARRSRAPDPGSVRPAAAGPQRVVGANPGSEDLPPRREDPPDWDAPWPEDEEEAALTGEDLPGASPSRLAAFIATCGFAGRVPIAPGTVGAAVGLGAFLLTRNLPGSVAAALFVVALAAGFWAAGRHARDLRQPDPRSVVVDEFCGMWLALVGTNPSVLVIVAAFVAFRFLDIVKPPPVRQAERLPGGIGIMADDLVAGGVVRLVLLLALGM
jgi:phosphatidylglycerophosphatase A